MGDVKAGIGVTYPLSRKSQVTFFANTSLKIANDFNQFFALGNGGGIQFASALNDIWQISLQAHIIQYYLSAN